MADRTGHSSIIFTLLFAFSLFFLNCCESVALLKIDITGSSNEGFPIAMSSFDGENEDEKMVGRDIAKVIADDLIRSGFFKLLDSSFFIEKISINNKPNFSLWSKIGVVAIVAGEVEIIKGSGEIKVKFKLWDPFTKRLTEGLIYKVKIESWRRIAHKIADKVYVSLIGGEGYFDTRVAFVAEQIVGNRKIKRLAIMDYDGKNIHILTNGRYIVLSPKFHPTQHVLTYTSYNRNKPQVFIFDIQTGAKTLIWSSNGMSFAPRFSNDGNSIILSVAKDGTTSIHEVDLRTGNARKLIGDSGTINTSPSYSSTGKEIAFISDKDGGQQVYIMDRNDPTDVRRVSHGEGAYVYAVFSPKDNLIAFSKILGDKFYTGVFSVDSGKEVIFSKSWVEEGITWAPNGKILMFHRQFQNGLSSLYMINLKDPAKKVRKVPIKINGSDPSWSPLLDK